MSNSSQSDLSPSPGAYQPARAAPSTPGYSRAESDQAQADMHRRIDGLESRLDAMASQAREDAARAREEFAFLRDAILQKRSSPLNVSPTPSHSSGSIQDARESVETNRGSNAVGNQDSFLDALEYTDNPALMTPVAQQQQPAQPRNFARESMDRPHSELVKEALVHRSTAVNSVPFSPLLGEGGVKFTLLDLRRAASKKVLLEARNMGIVCSPRLDWSHQCRWYSENPHH